MKAQWNSMRLYSMRQVEEVAIKKYGSFAALEEHRRSLCQSQTRKRKPSASNLDDAAESERIKARQSIACADIQASACHLTHDR